MAGHLRCVALGSAWQGIAGALLWAVHGRASQVRCFGQCVAGHCRCVALDIAWQGVSGVLLWTFAW